jgi:hypothetical protein
MTLAGSAGASEAELKIPDSVGEFRRDERTQPASFRLLVWWWAARFSDCSSSHESPPPRSQIQSEISELIYEPQDLA